MLSAMDEPKKPKFQPSDPLSKEMRRRREIAGQKLRDAAPRLRAMHRELNGEDDYDA